jgi:hypothetical protein
MHSHHPNAFGALFDNRRVFGLTGLCVSFHAFDKRAERRGATLFEPSRHVHHAQAVGQRLLARWPHCDARMRADRVEQHQYRLGDRAVVALHVEATQQSERVGDFLHCLLKLRSVDWMHGMESPYLQFTVGVDRLPIHEQRVVAEGNEGPAKGRIDPQLVIRPFDRGEGVAQRQDFLSIMKGTAAH